MIKEYTISNFKSFADSARLPIKPITLIYGPNSSGKSSILQSLLMLKQTLEEAENPKQVLATKGKFVDVGGYRDFIHNHDLNNEFSFKVMFKHEGKIIEHLMDDYTSFLDEIYSYEPISGINDIEKNIAEKDYGFEVSLSSEGSSVEINTAHLYIHDAWSYLLQYRNEKNYEKYREEKSKSVSLFQQAMKLAEIKKKDDTMDHNEEDFIEKEAKSKADPIVEKEVLNFKNMQNLYHNFILYLYDMNEQHDFIKHNLTSEMEYSFSDHMVFYNFLPKGINKPTIEFYDLFEDFGPESSGNISLLTLAAASRFEKFLKSIQYLGPLRAFPSRLFTYSALNRDFVGQRGEHVYDMLISDESILKAVNSWMERLQMNYRLKPVHLTDEEAEIFNLYALRLAHRSSQVTASIMDVGFGVSQILPLIVQAVVSKEKTLMIEQPELHLHPALQAEMGDLFIDSALGENGNIFLIESHSEHLLLRIMRRIRETSNGTLPEGMTPVRPEDVGIVYVESLEMEGDRRSIIREMPLNDQGELIKAWPGGFFEEGLREVF